MADEILTPPFGPLLRTVKSLSVCLLRLNFLVCFGAVLPVWLVVRVMVTSTDKLYLVPDVLGALRSYLAPEMGHRLRCTAA